MIVNELINIEKREIDKNNDRITYREQIRDIILSEGKVYRAELARRLGIKDVNNINREINVLIEQGLIEKDKDGRKVFYFPVNLLKPSTHISDEPEASEVLFLKKKTKPDRADKLFDVIASEDRWWSCKELCEVIGITYHNFGQSNERNLQLGRVIKRKDGRNTFYKKAGITPVKESVQLSTTEILVNRIPQLKAFRDFKKTTDNCSQSTIDQYEKEILLFYHWKNKFNSTHFTIYPVERITVRDIDQFLQFLDEERHYSATAKRGVVVALKSYATFLKTRNYIAHDFMAEVKAPRVEKKPQIYASVEEFWRLVAAACNGKDPTRDLAFLLVCADTGARVGEIETICREDINFEENILTIHGEKAKGIKGERKDRTLPISKLTAQYLQAVIEENKEIITPVYLWIHKKPKEIGNAVFLNRDKTFLRRRQIGNVLRRLRGQAGLENAITVHSFRRWLISHLTNQLDKSKNMRMDFVAQRVGHATDNQMTVDYMKMQPEYRAKYDQEYQASHLLNQPDSIAKFKSIVSNIS